MSIRYRSDVKLSDRYLIDADPRVLAVWDCLAAETRYVRFDYIIHMIIYIPSQLSMEVADGLALKQQQLSLMKTVKFFLHFPWKTLSWPVSGWGLFTNVV